MKQLFSFKTVFSGLLLIMLPSFFAKAQDGTPANPYPIKDKEALISLAQCINYGQRFSFENDLFIFNPNGAIPANGTGTCFEQTADIDMDGEAWFTIGNSSTNGFRGIYLGNGHKIQHLTLTVEKPALFCYPNGTIQDLTMEHPLFSGTVNNGGALATFVMGGTIKNCHVTGNSLVFNGRYCGALIGWVGTPSGAMADSINISHCSNSCNITSHYQQEDNDSLNSVAGVVACIRAQHYHVTRCFNTGNITSTYRPVFQKDTLCFAGVVGRGFLPAYPSEITFCYNTGNITAHCGYLGGVAGFFDEEGGVTNYTRCVIDYCFNTGAITGICATSRFGTDTIPSNYYSLPPLYADTNIDVFSLGGVVAPSKTVTRYCFNTGNITLTKHPHPKFSINGDQGVAGVGSIAEHCFNVGEISNYEKKTGRAAGVCRDTANHCFNAGCVYDRNPKYSFTPHNIAQMTYNSASDEQMSVDGQDGNLYPTSKVIGEFSSAINSLGNEHWIYEDGRYPRLRWTDTCDWARDIAKVACTPIVLSDTINDIHHVEHGLRFTGCENGVVWKAPADNCLLESADLNDNENCHGNSIQLDLKQALCKDFVTVAATWNGDTIKTVTLRRNAGATSDTLTVDNLNDLKALRDGINTGEAFTYRIYKLPRYAEGVIFKLTTDLDMQNEKPWESIGSVFSGSRFAGTFLGQGHTISNLSLDDDSVYFYRKSYVGGLFGMLSGEVRDLHFTNVTADSTVLVAGAVCALMNKGKIMNCTVKGRIETSSVNNNYATCGIGSIAGASLTTRIQDGNRLICHDTIVDCVNYAKIVTQVGRGTNLAAYSVGGIIGHGGVVMDCANAGDIYGGDECGFLGGIGGDLTTARHCFNTGRITIEKAPQFANYYVGGVVGLNAISHAVQYCYNAGIVDGSDRNHVGGIMGFGDPEYCYFSNTVTSDGAHVGSITGASSGGSDQANHCYYDKQLSPAGGVNGIDNTGAVEGLATTAMLGTALQNSLGVDTNWIFTEGLYPQLKSLSTLNSQLSRVSVMPVLLDNDQTWVSAHDSFDLGGCNEHYFWKKLHGNIKAVNGCNVNIGAHAMGVIELAATIDSVPYRHIKLKFNLDETHALIVKNAIQLDSLRRVINNADGGYYSFSDSTFHTKIPANTSSDDLIAITDGGNERFFKLINDIDLSGLMWFPIGGYTDGCCLEFQGTPFKGTFDGCGHTVRHLWLYWQGHFSGRGIYWQSDTCSRHQGLFGRIEGGTVKNLRIAQSTTTDDPDTQMGGSSAFLCSENHGTLYNCEIDSCTVTVSHYEYNSILYRADTLALLCAINEGGLIDNCRVLNSQMVNDRRSNNPNCVIGAVCALNHQGVVQNCRVKNLYFEDLRGTYESLGGYDMVGNGSTRAAGGICGKNYHGQLLNDTIKNSRFLFRIWPEHQNIGGICGINGDDNDNTDLTLADIPSIIKGCLSDSTIINGDTCVQGNCQKMAINFGGIVGLSQGHIVQIEGCETTAKSQLSVAADSVGGICGRFVGLGDQSSIRDCNNRAPVKGYGYVGGICGLVTHATISSCSNYGNVWSALGNTFSNRDKNPSGYYAGGIAGACIHRVTISSCNNEAGAEVKADSSYVGGIVGALLDGCQILESSNSGEVKGINQVGGIVGLLGQDAGFGTDYDGCPNHGAVKGIAQVGGLVGYAKSGSQPCKGHNSGTVQYASMGGRVYGYAEDPSLFALCTYDTNTTGQWENVITVSNVAKLSLIRIIVNNGNDNYEGKTIKLEDNLDLGSDWIPIGTPEHPFRGTFDGQGHTVYFTINAPSSDYQGLFGYMQGTVKNLYLYNCNVTGHDYVGGIAGYCHGTISNCGTKSSYSQNAKVVGNKYVGSLVGMARYAEILDCQNGINISGDQYVGGIVGDFVAYKNDDSYGKSNSGPNTIFWGKTLYYIYGGNVSRCFNFGMVKATNNDSYVGGIAGSTSTEMKHCYNSGIVDGKDKVGGIAGQLNGDSIHHCYNTGHVSATGTLRGGICGNNVNANLNLNFYDRQMCPLVDNDATPLYTRQMTGTALQSALGTDYWTYHSNEYPRIKYSDTIHSNAAAVSVKPLLLSGYMPADDIVQHFSGVTGDNVEWMHYGTTPATVLIQHLPSQLNRDTLLLKICNVDTLQVRASQTAEDNHFWEHRLVPIEVTGKIDGTHVTTDTTCSSTYTWEVNGVTYNKSGFYTWGNDCSDNRYALNLTIGHISCDFETIGSTCNDIADGVLMTTVSGGFGNGFRYKWSNASSDSIGNQPNLMGRASGHYTLTLTDSTVSRCSYTGNVTLGVQSQVALTIAGCSESRHYDGTALTGTRFVVTEEGHLPDTVAASHFAVLSNGDTLRVTLSSDSITNTGSLENTVAIFSYTIKNGIDHSCHYSVTTPTGSLTVTPQPVLITVNDAYMEYGNAAPPLTGTVTGLVDEGDLGTIEYYYINDTLTHRGTYPDTLSASYTPNPNYVVTINKGDLWIDCRHLTTKISHWLTDTSGINDCFSETNTSILPSADLIRTLIDTSVSDIAANEYTVAMADEPIKTSHCDWEWERTYTITTTNTGFCLEESRVLHVSGSDQTDPVRSDNYLWVYGTLYQDACLASFDMDKFLPADQDLFFDCSPMTITHTDTYTGNDGDGWTIHRSYEVTDACGHTIHDYIEVSGRDQTPPMAYNTSVKNDTLWADYVQCLCDSIHVINDFTELKTLFGLSDECTGDDISLVSKTRTFKTGDHCADTVVVAYTVADPYGNAKTFYHAQFIQDTIGPTFKIVPFHDTTLCVDPDGNYENTVNRIASLVSLANIQDNCTKGNMVVDASITFDPSEHDNDGYDTDSNLGEVTYGKRTYSQVWSVTDSCGNTTRNMLYIHLYPLATIRIDSLGSQEITYGQDIKDVLIHHQYSNLALYPLNFGGISLDNNDDTTGTLKGTPDSAGTFIYTLRATSWHDCNIVDTTVTIEVAPRPITITAASATKKYDGKPLTSNNYICTLTPPFGDINNNILVPGDSIASVTITGSQTHVGTNLNTPSNARITICTADTVDKNPSYAITYANGTLEVTTNDTLIRVIPGSGTKVYDGTPLTKTALSDFTVIGVPEGLTWTATADGTVTNVIPGAGEKTVNAVTSFHIFDADGVDVTAYFTNIHTDSTGTLTITKKPLTITADNATRVYDGTALTKNSYTNTELVDGETITSVTITGSQTIAGTSNNVPSDAVIKNDTLKDVTSNYDITYENGTLTVMQKSLTITAGSDTIIYNGAWLTNNTYTHSALVAGDSLWSVTITGRALYGESNNVPSDAVIKNPSGDTVTNSYNINYLNGHLKIKQKKLTITSGDSSKVYDGTDLTCHTFTYSGLVESDYIESVQMPSVLSWADTIDNDIYGPNIQNSTVPTYYNSDTNVTNCYEITYVKGKLMVEKKPLTITAGSATKEYDGTELTEDSFTHTELVPGDSIWSVSIVGSQTVAGTSANKPSEADIQNSSQVKVSVNYDITYVDGTLEVTPRPLTITADGDTKEYDGTPLTKESYTHTDLIARDAITSVTFTGSQTLVGSSNNVPSAAVILNDTNENVTASYAITYSNGTLEVTPNTTAITVVPASGSKTYDGTPLTKTAHDDFTVTGVPEGFSWTATADGTVTNVVPGTGEKTVNAVSDFQILTLAGDTVTDQFANIDTSATDTLIVTAKAVTLASGSKTREYNGSALTNSEVADINANGLTTETGWADGEGATCSFTASQLYVGSCTNAFDYTLNDNTTASNYTITKTEGTLEVTASTTELKVTSADGSWTYDGNAHTIHEYTVTYGEESYPVTITSPATTGTATLSTGDVVTITPVLHVATITHVAEYIVTNAFNWTVQNSDQYSRETKRQGALTVTPATLTITTGTAERDYDGTPLTASGSISGFVTPTDGSEETASFTVTGSQTVVGSSENSYNLIWDGTASESDYTLSEELGTLTVTPAQILVKADAKSKVYATDEPTLTATVTGVVENEDFVPIYTVSRISGENVGQYVITPNGEVFQGNYAVTFDTALMTITPVSILVKADAKSRVYGTDDPTFTATVTGVVAGDDFTPTYTLARATGENIGEYVITPGGDVAQGNYTVSYDTALLTITPASLLVKADAQSKVYGDNDPTLTATFTGLVLNDDESIVTYSLSRVTGENIGEYIITPSGDVAQGNYTITYDTALLTVTPAQILVKADATSKVYGTADPTLTATVTGVIAGDSFSPVYVISRATGDTVGDYVITTNGEAAQGNYIVTYDTALLTITPASLLVKANAQSKVYGDNDPTFTATVTGVIAGESFLPDYNITRATGEIVGEYVITPSGDIAQGNYTVTYDTALLIVNPKPLTVTAASDTREYDGTALTASGYTHSALVSGDTVESVTMTGNQVLVGTSSNVPSAAVIRNASLEDMTANYEITYVNGTLEVTQNTGAITVVPGSGSKTYDGTPLTKTEHEDFSVTGLSEGFTWTASADGTVTNVVPGDGEKAVNAVSDFRIYNSDGEEVTDQFSGIDISATGTLEVTEKAATITVADAVKTYGQADPAFTGSVEGLVNDADLGDITYFRSNTDEAVGSYASVLTAAYTANSNYSVAIDSGDFTVNPKAVTITAADATKPYDGSPLTQPAFTATVLEEGDNHAFSVVMTDASTLTHAGTQPNVIATVDGVAVTTGTDTEVGNYTVTVVDGTLEVTEKAVTITVADAVKTYGQADPVFTGSVEGLVNDADLGDITYFRSNTDEAVGSYASVLTAAYTANSNYSVAIDSGDFTVNPKAVTITAADATKPYDGSPLTQPAFTATALEDGDNHAFSVVMTDASTLTYVGSQPNVIATVDGVAVTTGTETEVGNYTVTVVDGILEVTQNTGAITVVPGSGSKTYDGTPLTRTEHEDFSVTGLPEGFTWTASADGTVTNVVPGDGEKAVNAVSDFKIYNSDGEEVTDQFSGIDISATGTLEVTEKAATITVADAVKTYGQDDPAFTGSVEGLVNAADLGDITYFRSNTDEAVGSYANVLTAAYTANSNYSVAIDSGDFTVTPKAVTITAADATKPYDGSALTQPGFTATALEEGDNHAFSVVMTDASTLTYAGTQPNVIATVDGVAVTTGTETAVGNYTVTVVDGTLEVTEKAVTITVADAVKTYGQADPVFTGSVEGLVNDADLGDISFFRSNTDEAVGSYSSVLTAAYTANSNYSVAIDSGDFTVNPKAVTITAADATKPYDGSPLTQPAFSATALEDGDNHSFTVAMTDASTLTYVGSQPNVIATVDGVAVTTGAETEVGNYTVTVVDGILEVTQNTGAITVVPGSGSKTYDGTPLTRTEHEDFTVTGLPEGFTWTASADGTVTNVVPGDGEKAVNAVSDFRIYNSDSEEVTDQFSGIDISATGTLEVTEKAATITVADAEKTYGQADPAFTGSVEGLVNAADLGDISFFRSNTDEAVGSYASVLTAAYTANPNYLVTLTEGSFTIYCRTIDLLTEASWPENITGQNNSFADADTTGLLDAHEIQALFDHSDDITVEISDEATATDDYQWTWTRTYTVSDLGGCQPLTGTMSVSGGDLTAPELTITDTPAPTAAGSCQYEIPTVAYSVTDNGAAAPTVTQAPAAGTMIAQTAADQTVTITLTATDACGNSTEQTTTVTVPAQPALTLQVANDVICLDGSTDVTATTTGTSETPAWTVSPATGSVVNGTFSATAADSYTLTVTVVDNGCSLSDETTIVVAPLPTVDVTPASQTITYGDAITPVEIGNTNSTVSLSALPDGLSYNSTTQTLTGTPTASGTHVITATATSDIVQSCSTAEQTITIVVDKRAASITVDNASKLYGEGDPAFTGSIAGLLHEGDLGMVEYYRSNSDEAVGSYAGVLTASYTANPNYEVTVHPGDFLIECVNTLTLPADGWHAIASMWHDNGQTYWTLNDYYTAGTYDMFRYDEASASWENQKAGNGATGFNQLERGRGYIYRCTDEVDICIGGTAHSGSFGYTLSCTPAAGNLQGFHLIGNPYGTGIYKGSNITYDAADVASGYYALQPDGTWLVRTDDIPIDAGQGILIQATEATELTFTDNLSESRPASTSVTLAFTVSNGVYEDVAYAQLENGAGLRKTAHLNEEAPMLSIPVEGRRYALAKLGESPQQFNLNFQPSSSGEYTLSFGSLNDRGSIDYLHLIDLVAGSDIDLLRTPSYTFQGSPLDNSSRFLVKLSSLPLPHATAQAHFADIEGDRILVTGNGLLQVFDALGRCLASVRVTDYAVLDRKALGMYHAGVYLLRLGNDTQKIVIN